MEEIEKRNLLDKTLSKLNYLGLVINLMVPAALLTAGAFINNILTADFVMAAESLNMLKWILVGVSVIEVGVAFFLKRKLFGNLFKNTGDNVDMKAQLLMATKIMLVIHVMSATPVVYGFIYHILGGTIEGFLLIIIINLSGYQLCRARKSDYEDLRKMLLGGD